MWGDMDQRRDGLVRGAWRVARGAWRVARGAWRVVRGAWCVVRATHYRPLTVRHAACRIRTVRPLVRGAQIGREHANQACKVGLAEGIPQPGERLPRRSHDLVDGIHQEGDDGAY